MVGRLVSAPVAPDSGRWKPVQRGVPEGFEVLTEWGWVDFDALYEVGVAGGSVRDLLVLRPELLSGFVSAVWHLFTPVGDRWGLGSGGDGLYDSVFGGVRPVMDFSVLLSRFSGGVEGSGNSLGSVEELLGAPLFGVSVPFVGNGRAVGGYGVRYDGWERWETGVGFPRVATVNPVSGSVFFVRPVHFVWGDYIGKLVWLKMKGVDLLSTLFSDYWVRPKYGRAWKFVLGDDMVRAGQARTGAASMNYQLLNKLMINPDGLPGVKDSESVVRRPSSGWSGEQLSGQSEGLLDLYGWWSPAEFLGVPMRLPATGGSAGVGVGRDGLEDSVLGLSSLLRVAVEAPITVYPKKHLSREQVWSMYPGTGDVVRSSVSVFSLVVAPYHNMVVRRGKQGSGARAKWFGGPVVFGDALDKSELLVAGRKGLLAGGSYSVLRPDYRTLRADLIKKDLGPGFGSFDDVGEDVEDSGE